MQLFEDQGQVPIMALKFDGIPTRPKEIRKQWRVFLVLLSKRMRHFDLRNEKNMQLFQDQCRMPITAPKSHGIPNRPKEIRKQWTVFLLLLSKMNGRFDLRKEKTMQVFEAQNRIPVTVLKFNEILTRPKEMRTPW